MPWKGQTEFTARPFVPWKSKAEGGKEKKVGTFKEVEVSMVEGSKKKTKFSFVTIDGSGHLVSGIPVFFSSCDESTDC